MESALLVLDPDGDVVLVVEIPDGLEEAEEPIPLEAQPEEDIWRSPPTRTETPASANEPPSWDDGVTDDGTPPEEEHVVDESFGESSHDIGRPKIRMRVSSSHLRLASPYFKRMFQSGWPEGDALRVEGRAEVRLQNDEDPDALLIILNIIHGHTRRVPGVVDLTMLTKIAVLVDFYECYEAVEIFSNMWIDSLKGDLPQSISTKLTQWIWVTWVFSKPQQFKAATQIAGRQNKGPIETDGVPIPQKVVEQIDQQRQKSIDRIISALDDLLDHFKSDNVHCSFECDSILLGALTKEMKSKKLSSQYLRPQFLGLSYEDAVDKVRNIRSPSWYAYGRYHYDEHGCNIGTHVKPVLASLDDFMCGLDLKDFPSRQGEDA